MPMRKLKPRPAPPARLSLRGVLRYVRLSHRVAVLAVSLREQKPGPVAAETIAFANGLLDEAQRVFAREPDIAKFVLLPSDAKLSLLDLHVVTNQLVDACLVYEQRHKDMEQLLEQQTTEADRPWHDD